MRKPNVIQTPYSDWLLHNNDTVTLVTSPRALIIIDCQKEFTRNCEDTYRAAQKIPALAEAFRNAGQAVYGVISVEPTEFDVYNPQYPDTILSKKHSSVVRGSGITSLWDQAGHHTLYFAGLYKSRCIYESIIDAQQDFTTKMIDDATADRDADKLRSKTILGNNNDITKISTNEAIEEIEKLDY